MSIFYTSNLFQNNVFNILIKDHGLSIEQAEKAMVDYEEVFEKINKISSFYRPTEAYEIEFDVKDVAYRIKHDIDHGITPDQYLESATYSHDFVKSIVDSFDKKNDNTSLIQRHEFCKKCGYPKYIDKECTFC